MSAAPVQADGLSPRERTLAVAAAIACVSVGGVGLSLSTPLISLALAAQGVPATVIGLNGAFGSIGTLLIVPFIPRLAARIGLRLLLGLTLLAGAVTMALFPVFDSLTSWFVLRFVFGASMGTLFSLSEFWITAAALPHRRGAVMGIYATALSLGFALGPSLLAAAGGVSPVLFGIGAAFFLVAMIPILLAGSLAPPMDGESRGHALAFVWLAPVATFAAFAYGAMEQGSFAFLPLYGEAAGLKSGEAAFLLTLFGLGNVASQVPLGLLSDKVDRPTLLLACTVISLAGALAMPYAAGTPLALMAVVFVTGGVVGGLYPVGLAHLGARYSGQDLAAANAAFVMLYSFGMLVGSPAMGAIVDAVRPNGFAHGFAALCAAYGLLVAWRIAVRRT